MLSLERKKSLNKILLDEGFWSDLLGAEGDDVLATRHAALAARHREIAQDFDRMGFSTSRDVHLAHVGKHEKLAAKYRRHALQSGSGRGFDLRLQAPIR